MRKIIYKAVTGSHLYGTSTPTSDLDYSGVFLPSPRDLLSLQSCPTEWSFNETGIDCKYYSLPRFMELAAQGQPGQLELFFVPAAQRLISTPEWQLVEQNAPLFFSQQGIKPFIGFALAQAHKSTIKGSNLNIIRQLITHLEKLALNEPLSSHFSSPDVHAMFSGGLIETVVNDHGFNVLKVAGRKYDINLKTKTFVNNLKELEKRYGERSEAAAALGTDFKSLMHAERLIGQAEEFLSTGSMTMPRPNAEELKLIRTGVHGRMDWHDYLQDRITKVREISSTLPAKPDRTKIDVLCMQILSTWLQECDQCNW
jgi:hypothetical protein